MEIMTPKGMALIKVEIFSSIDLHLYNLFFWFPSLMTATLLLFRNIDNYE